MQETSTNNWLSNAASPIIFGVWACFFLVFFVMDTMDEQRGHEPTQSVAVSLAH